MRARSFSTALVPALLPFACLLGAEENRFDASVRGAAEVRRLFETTRCSGLEMLMREDVALEVSPLRREWVLRRFGRLKPDGSILLEEGGAGTCETLSAYAQEELGKSLGRRYRFRLVESQETGFFMPPKGVHVVLLMIDRADRKRAYVVDPSFKRFGPYKDFDDYIFTRELLRDPLRPPEDRSRVDRVGMRLPLLIRNGYLLSFVVSGTDGRFGPGDYSVLLNVKRRHALLAGRRSGKETYWEDPSLLELVLSPQERGRLTARIKELLRAAGTN